MFGLLQNLFNRVTNKPVEPRRSNAESMLIFLAGAAIIGLGVYASVRYTTAHSSCFAPPKRDKNGRYIKN